MRGARRALLLAALLPVLLPSPPASAHGGGPVLVFVLDIGFEGAVRDGTLRSIASTGGIGLLAETEPIDEVIAELRATRAHGDVTVIEGVSPGDLEMSLRTATAETMPMEKEILVLAVSSSASPGSGVVVMGGGTPGQLLGNRGPVPGLTSETTGRPGLVSNVDLAATVLAHLGHPDPDAPGNPIYPDGFEPAELRDLYAEYRTVVVPVGLVVLRFALAAVAVGLAILLGGWRPAPGVGRVVAVLGLFAVSLNVAMLPGSWLPDYSWPVVLGTLLGVGAVVTGLALWIGRRSAHTAAATVAGAGAALVVVDAALGWRSLLTPLLGGSALEGSRFYGLGNSYAGLLLSGLVLVCAVLPPWLGVVVLAVGALFAGAPWTGADLGGGLTLFAAAGIWWALAVRRRLGLVEVVAVVGAVVLGAAVLVLLHRTVAEPSHVTRAVEAAGGVPEIAGSFMERLRLNLAATARTPAVWPALGGVVVATVAAWRRWRPFLPALHGHPLWRPAVMTLGISAIVGYILNDTYGLTGVAFVYLALALVYPSLEKMFGRNGKKSQSSKQTGWTYGCRFR